MNPTAARSRRWLLSAAGACVLAPFTQVVAAAPKSADPGAAVPGQGGHDGDEVTQLLGKPQRTRKFQQGRDDLGYPTRKSETWFLMTSAPTARSRGSRRSTSLRSDAGGARPAFRRLAVAVRARPGRRRPGRRAPAVPRARRRPSSSPCR